MKNTLIFDSKVFFIGVGELRIALTPLEWTLMRLLHRHYGDVVPKATIDSMLYDMCDEARGANAQQTLIKRLRPKLAPLGLSIWCRYGFGYALMATAALPELPVRRDSRALKKEERGRGV